MSDEFIEAIDAAVDFVIQHPEEMARGQVDDFKLLAAAVYKFAAGAGLVASLPQVPELIPELEHQGLPPVQFASKLHLPGDWFVAEADDKPLLPTAEHDAEQIATDDAKFMVGACPRWFEDMKVLRELARNVDEYLPAESPTQCAKRVGVHLNTLKRYIEKDKCIRRIFVTKRRWRLHRGDVLKMGGKLED